MMNKNLALTLVSTVATLAFSASAHAAPVYAYYQNGWAINVASVHQGLAATTYNGIKINARGPVTGAGVTVGVLDTGTTSSWIGFKGTTNGATGKVIANVNCLGATCVSAPANNDGHGHGTFTMSEIIGGYNTYVGSTLVTVPGIAPNANAIGIKVLNDSGSGDTNGLARGIAYGANNGANVLNISIGPSGGTPAQLASFYSSLAGTVNAAAAKGTYISFAGGNSAQLFAGGATITGFSDEALKRMIFVGSTNNSGVLSSFSNTPGTGKFISTSGKVYDYASMWVSAPGENLTGASNLTGMQGSVNCGVYSCLSGGWSGTSMAAPEVSGTLALLVSQWPVLKTNGAAAQIIEYAASWLPGGTTMTNGVTQYNSKYGQGFLNVAAAFQPIGNLTASNLAGKSIVLNGSTTSAMLGSSALSTATLTTLLKNYTSFDMFARNFSVDISSLVATKATTSTAAASLIAKPISTSVRRFADGSSLAFGNAVEENNYVIDRPSNTKADKAWFMSFTDASGSTMAAGNGMSASASFAGALWGTDSTVSSDIASLGVSDALMNLAGGGAFTAYGTQLDEQTRVALSWSQTQQESLAIGSDWTKPDATSFGMGFTNRVSESWMTGVTFNLLNEQNGLLGTTYNENGPLSLGHEHTSLSMGVSSAFSLGGKRNLVFDAAIMRSNGAQIADGLISDISPLYAQSFGAALVQRDAVRPGDNLAFSVRAPMRVFSGSANIAVNSVDEDGNPVISKQRVNLRATGQEMDFSMGYSAPVSETMSWNMSLNARHDAGNISGAHDADFLVGTKIRF